MLKATRTLMGFVALTLLLGVLPAWAQDSPQAQEQSSLSAQGQLVRVDTKASTLTIRTAAGAEMQFRYTDTTKVTGASEGVSGLATMSGADVTVHYTKQEEDNIATQIDIRPKK